MPRRARWLALAGAGALLAQPGAFGATPPRRTDRSAQAAPIARLALVERHAEISRDGAHWERAIEGASVSVGDQVRVGEESVGRLELAWMSLTLGPGARLRFPNELLLSASLDSGRALVDSGARDALTIVAGDAFVRGRGRAVVRREARAALVTCLRGSFRVSAAGIAVTLQAGEGTVADGRGPGRPEPAPRPPGGIWPARDPVYIAQRSRLDLRWEGDAPAYQIELLPVGSETVLVQRDVARAPAGIEIPWAGAFRWRVSSRDRRGLEGPPSPDGLIAVE